MSRHRRSGEVSGLLCWGLNYATPKMENGTSSYLKSQGSRKTSEAKGAGFLKSRCETFMNDIVRCGGFWEQGSG